MDNPGFHALGAFTITTAGTQVGEWVDGFDGLLALTAQLKLSWGSGGTTIQAYLQTSIDQGNTVADIWCCLFGAASEVAIENFSKLTPKTTQIAVTDGTLANDTSIDGILGSQFRLKVVSTGTYAGSTVLTASADAS